MRGAALNLGHWRCQKVLGFFFCWIHQTVYKNNNEASCLVKRTRSCLKRSTYFCARTWRNVVNPIVSLILKFVFIQSTVKVFAKQISIESNIKALQKEMFEMEHASDRPKAIFLHRQLILKLEFKILMWYGALKAWPAQCHTRTKRASRILKFLEVLGKRVDRFFWKGHKFKN